ncbi:hypothetical protein COCCADRAFT_112974, partial [Bipolaris zeicola 26-R-13]
ARERRKLLLTLKNSSVVVRIKLRIKTATRINNKSFKIRRTTSKDLIGSNRRTSYNRRVIAQAGTEDGIVRAVTTGAAEEVKYAPDILLNPINPRAVRKEKKETYRGGSKDATKLISDNLIKDILNTILIKINYANNVNN